MDVDALWVCSGEINVYNPYDQRRINPNSIFYHVLEKNKSKLS